MEDSQAINSTGNVEIKIPPDILLKIREGRDERGQPILKEISASLPDIVQADMSGVKRAKAPQITRFELSSQPMVESSLLVYQIKSEENVEKFFKPLDKVRNPFYNRKVYENANNGSTVSFTGYNLK